MSKPEIEARLKITDEEIMTLIDWIPFQGEMSEKEIEFSNKLEVVRGLLEEEDYPAAWVWIWEHECKMIEKWYTNLSRCLLDQRDADLNIIIKIFLAGDYEEPIQTDVEETEEPE